MAQPSTSNSALDLVVKEVKQIFDAHKEPIDMAMDKKLIINVAASGAFVEKRHNPYLPITTKEVSKEVAGAYNAGASMWHFHPRDPENGMAFIPLEKRLRIHKEWCDSVFDVAPDIVTDVGAIYVTPPALTGRVVEEKSILAETRVAPLIDPLIKMGPNNRYVEIAIILPFTGALGSGTNLLGFNNKAGVVSEVRLLQSKGIRVELSPFQHMELLNVKEWVIDSGIAKPPVILDTLIGVHNTPGTMSGMEAFEFLFSYVRMLPKGVMWQALLGGRYWMPLTVVAIILGADIVRIGMEDDVYMYPHRDDYIDANSKAVEAIAGIARFLGREVANPSETRTILGLPQISVKA